MWESAWRQWLRRANLFRVWLRRQPGQAARTPRREASSRIRDLENLEGRLLLAANPVAIGANVVVTEDRSFGGPLAGTDADGDTLRFSIGPLTPAHGTLVVAENGFFIYQPLANYNGSDAFSFVVNDGTSNSSPATVTITVSAVNDLPVVNSAMIKTRSGTPVSGQLTGSDADQDALTFSPGAVAASQGVITISPNGAFTYVSNAGYIGPDVFSVRANDGQANGPEATVSVTVGPPNQAPTFVNGSSTLSKNTTLNGSVTALVADGDGDPLTFVVVSQPAHGSVALNSSGTFACIPNADYTGPDFFTVKANDGFADSNVATFSLTIQSGDQPLALNLPGTPAPVFRDSVKVRIDPTASVADPDSTVSYSNARITASIPNLPLDDNKFGRITLSLQSQGTGVGLVSVKGTKIYFNGSNIAVASFTGGTYGKPLSITFTNAATEQAVNAVLKQITIQAGKKTVSVSLAVNLLVSAGNQIAQGTKSVGIVPS